MGLESGVAAQALFGGRQRGRRLHQYRRPHERIFHQGPGQHGGEPTPLNKVYVIQEGKKTQIKDPRLPIQFKHGDHFIIMSGGGAGVGNPSERDPEKFWRTLRTNWCRFKWQRMFTR